MRWKAGVGDAGLPRLCQASVVGSHTLSMGEHSIEFILPTSRGRGGSSCTAAQGHRALGVTRVIVRP